MSRTERRVQEFRSLWLLLIVVGMLAGGIITSCGGSGGGSDGELCDQCGDDPDGPCLPSIMVTEGAEGAPQCTFPVNPGSPECIVELACRRKVDSGQRRCYPLVVTGPGLKDVDYQFRCDGSRPGGTPRPQPTVTLTPEPEMTATPVPQTCNNQVREGTEECDAPDFGTATTCASRNCGMGPLGCTVECKIDFGLCSDFALGCN